MMKMEDGNKQGVGTGEWNWRIVRQEDGDNKAVWPTWTVDALFRRARRIYQELKNMYIS
jgi:hypothetical protein